MIFRSSVNAHVYKIAFYPLCLILVLLSTPSLSQVKEPDSPLRGEINSSENSDNKGGSEKPKWNDIFGFNIGMSGGYSSGVSVSNWHYRPYANLFLKHKYIKGTIGIYRCQDYLLTDGEGNYENINFTQPKIGLSIYPHDVLELYGEYRYSTGDYSHYYRGHEGTAGFLLDFGVVTIDASCNKRIVQYEFKSVNWANRLTLLYSDISHHGMVTQFYSIDLNSIKYLDDISATVNLTWNVIESTSIDLTYYYLYSSFKYPRDSYYLHNARLGVYSDVWKHISIHGGASLGLDAEGYIIAGADAGATCTIIDHVTITATYLPSYFIAPGSRSALDRFVENYIFYNYSYTIGGTTNPYLQPSLAGKSFWNHSVNFNVAFRY